MTQSKCIYQATSPCKFKYSAQEIYVNGFTAHHGDMATEMRNLHAKSAERGSAD